MLKSTLPNGLVEGGRSDGLQNIAKHILPSSGTVSIHADSFGLIC